MNDFIGFILFLLLVIAMFALGGVLGYSSGYEVGQIDAMNGRVYYCLEKQKNSSFIWEYHSEGCKK